MKQSLFLLVALMFLMGCSSVREDPDDSFAPRPENAESESFRIVRLSENAATHRLNKMQLLEIIQRYRKEYEVEKPESDFDGAYSDYEYERYRKRFQAFKDSDIDAAVEYIKSWPDYISFEKPVSSEKKYDIGDIGWTDEHRKLRIVDFYGQYYADDWSAYAFVINMIPTSRNGYARLELDVNGEKLAFRKTARRKIWSFSSKYFWVHTGFLTLKGAENQVPLILYISDPNDRQDMSGIYLVMPKEGVSVDTSALDKIREEENKAKQDPNYVAPAQLDYGPYSEMTAENLEAIEFFLSKTKLGLSYKEAYELWEKKTKQTIGITLRSLAYTCESNPEYVAMRIKEVKRLMSKKEKDINTSSKVKVLVKTGTQSSEYSGPWSIINKETFPVADIIQHELGRSRTPEQVTEHFRKYIKSFNDEELLKDLIELCQKDRKKFKRLLEPFRKK